MDYVAERIRQEMETQGLGPYSLAKRAHLAADDITKILDLGFIGSLTHLESIAEALGLDVDEMIALADKTWWEQRTAAENATKGIEWGELPTRIRDFFPDRTT